MSYILDALNKSEQERERKQTPGLKSLQGEPSPKPVPAQAFPLPAGTTGNIQLHWRFHLFRQQLPARDWHCAAGKSPSADSLVPAIAATVDTPHDIFEFNRGSTGLVSSRGYHG